jgi:hypothetical protein
VHEIVAAVEPWDDQEARAFAGWRWWTFEQVLAADLAVLGPHLQRFTAKLADRLAADRHREPIKKT